MGIPVGGLILAGVLAAVVFFRKEIGETGTFLGRGFGEFGTGVQRGISALTSPSIRPEFVPTVGFKTELPGQCGPGENMELKLPWVSCRPGGVGSGPITCCYPRETTRTGGGLGGGGIGGGEVSGYAIAGPSSQLEADLASVRYDGRVGTNLIPIPGEPGGFYDPRFISDPRLDGRPAANFP